MKYQQPIINAAADATLQDRPYHRMPLTYRLAKPELLVATRAVRISAPEPTAAMSAEAKIHTSIFVSLLAAAVGFIAWGLIAGGHC
jgi:hypothetical protein